MQSIQAIIALYSVQFYLTHKFFFRFRTFFDECNDKTGKDETKSCVFHGFLNTCSVDRNDTFVKLSNQILSKIKDSSAKRQDGLQLNLALVQSKLNSHNSCYLHYTC